MGNLSQAGVKGSYNLTGTHTETQYDIIICGCGPAGAILANLLRDYNYKVAIFDQDKEIYYAPRAVGGDDDGMRILQAIGVLDDLGDNLDAFPGCTFSDANGKELMRYTMGDTTFQGHPSSINYYQPGVEKVLRQQFEKGIGVDAYLGHEVRGVKDEGERCSLIAKNLKTGELSEYTSRYIVGCDGAASFVRTALRSGRKDLDFSEKWFVVDTIVKDQQDFDAMPDYAEWVCDDERPRIYAMGRCKHVRFDALALEGETLEDFKEYLPKFIANYGDPEKYEVIRIAPYTFYAGAAEHWRRGRLFVAGDAAHVTPPFAGQGLMTGMRDTMNLAFKLDLVLSGKCTDSILDTYEQERKPHALETIKGAILHGKFMYPQNVFSKAIRNTMFFLGRNSEYLNSKIKKSGFRKLHYHDGLFGFKHGLSGTLSIQPTVVASSGEELMLDEITGKYFSLLTTKSTDSSVVEEFRDRVNGSVFEIDKDFKDNTGILKNWMSEHGVSFVIIRPDKYVFDAGNNVAELCASLYQLCGDAPSL